MRMIDADALAKEWEGSYYEGTVKSLLDTAPTIEPDTDTISRQAAIDLIERYCDNGCEIAEYKWCPDCQQSKFAEMIKALPPSPSISQWIPVSERLPEHSCQTLVTTKWDTEYSVEYGFYWGEDNKWGTITNNVIAWMPLPEPYHRP